MIKFMYALVMFASGMSVYAHAITTPLNSPAMAWAATAFMLAFTGFVTEFTNER